MNAQLDVESPQRGARRLFNKDIQRGFVPERLYPYTDEYGAVLFYKVRLRHRNGDKLIRSMHLDGDRYVAREPDAPPGGKPLYRLHRLRNDPFSKVHLVEGEECVDALEQRGLLATTSGGATSCNGRDWSPLAGRDCVIWCDNDLPGEGYGLSVADRLQAFDADFEIIDVSALGLQPGQDCVDWLAAHPGATPDDIRNLPKLAPPPRGPAPEPLRRATPSPPPYPVEALGPLLGSAQESLRRVIQAPDAICGSALLAVASLAVQGRADITLDGRVHPPSLWFLSVAESGERKSAVDHVAMQPARAHERTLEAAHASEYVNYVATKEEWQSRCDAARKQCAKASGEGLAAALLQIGPEPPPPLQPIVVAADFTADGLTKLLAGSRPSMGAFTDEAALVFGGHGMSKESVTRTAATMCKLWDRGDLDRIRAGDGSSKLHGRRLAMHLMAQPVVAERALTDEVLSGQGFTARCLISWPPSTAGTRTYQAENLDVDPALNRYCARASELFARPLPLAEGTRNELAPPPLTLSPEATALWRQLHDAVEAEMGTGGKYSTVKASASKTPEQCLRIAGVLSLFENPDARAIEVETLQRAAELALWHLNEAARLTSKAVVSPEVRNAEALLQWAHDHGRRYIYSTMAMQRGPTCIRQLRDFNLAMAELERAGWATPVPGGLELDGKPRRKVWRIEPEEVDD